MFNPFERFTPKFIDAFRKMGKSYLVSQTYPRGFDPFIDKEKTSLLFSHYDNLSHANIHLSALKGDKNAAIIDLENEKHRARISEMLKKDSNFIIFSSLILNKAELEKRLDRKYKENIRRFVNQRTTWRIPASETIYPTLDIAFGELFILLKWRRNQIRFKLDELETT